MRSLRPLGMDWKRVLSYLDIAFPRSGFIEGKKVAELIQRYTDVTDFFNTNFANFANSTNKNFNTKDMKDHKVKNKNNVFPSCIFVLFVVKKVLPLQLEFKLFAIIRAFMLDAEFCCCGDINPFTSDLDFEGFACFQRIR